jgi:ubiquinone biosynthesis protein
MTMLDLSGARRLPYELAGATRHRPPADALTRSHPPSAGGVAWRLVGRLLLIIWAATKLALIALGDHWRAPSGHARLPGRLRDTLERLGPTFVKFGQALSLRRDLLGEDYVTALRGLQDQVGPFPGRVALSEVERAFGRKIDDLFASFEIEPLAAASIAQVHAATMKDGRAAIVKVRRPDIRVKIDRDMGALRVAAKLLARLAPGLQRHQPVRIVEEIWTNLRKEADFRQEARNIQRFVEAFRDWPNINIPRVVDDLAAESVVVQERSSGCSIDDTRARSDGARLAQVFVDAYLHQFFVVGVFHGDPHPGNLFVMADGRLCFHDFGLVGFLDRPTRRSLAVFVQAFVRQDAPWVFDTAIDLGVLGGEMDRTEFVRAIEEILADFAALPIKEWSLAEAFLRVMRLGDRTNVRVPHNLLVLMRAMFLIENALRTLDPEMNVIDTLVARGADVLTHVMQESLAPSAATRLKTEAAVTVQDLPVLLASWLHRTVREEGHLGFTLKHEGLKSLEQHLDRSGNRVALALVTLGLYIAASLLMQHSLGPRLFGEMPALAALGYGLALWFTFRIALGISRAGRL